ncbi:MAG TPA: OadG family transporter subunit [Synergistales bacterium]|nr:OadG family transporter subunit [Synergistales bacterium]
MSVQFGDVFQGLGGGALLGLITLSIVFLALSSIALIIFGVKYLVAILDASGSVGDRKILSPKPVSVESRLPVESKDDGEILAAIAAAVSIVNEAPAKIRSIRPMPEPKAVRISSWKITVRREGFEGIRENGG